MEPHGEDLQNGSQARRGGRRHHLCSKMPTPIPPDRLRWMHFELKRSKAEAKFDRPISASTAFWAKHNLNQLEPLAKGRRDRLQAVPRQHEPATCPARRTARSSRASRSSPGWASVARSMPRTRRSCSGAPTRSGSRPQPTPWPIFAARTERGGGRGAARSASSPSGPRGIHIRPRKLRPLPPALYSLLQGPRRRT